MEDDLPVLPREEALHWLRMCAAAGLKGETMPSGPPGYAIDLADVEIAKTEFIEKLSSAMATLPDKIAPKGDPVHDELSRLIDQSIRDILAQWSEAIARMRPKRLAN